MRAYAKTDIGPKRPVNEDSYRLPEGEERFAVVADGMGGHQAGEVASAMAVSEFTRWLRCAPVRCPSPKLTRWKPNVTRFRHSRRPSSRISTT